MKPMLLRDLEPHHDVCGWLASEKLDGWRAVWDGAQLISREGLIIPCPAWFTENFPAALLDGELYAGRGLTFADVASIVYSRDESGWHRLRFHAFDAPSELPFSERMDAVFQACYYTDVIAVEHELVSDYNHAREIARRYKLAGGEGAVFRNPAGLYEYGKRSQNVLRFKP